MRYEEQFLDYLQSITLICNKCLEGDSRAVISINILSCLCLYVVVRLVYPFSFLSFCNKLNVWNFFTSRRLRPFYAEANLVCQNVIERTRRKVKLKLSVFRSHLVSWILTYWRSGSEKMGKELEEKCVSLSQQDQWTWIIIPIRESFRKRRKRDHCTVELFIEHSNEIKAKTLSCWRPSPPMQWA